MNTGVILSVIVFTWLMYFVSSGVALPGSGFCSWANLKMKLTNCDGDQFQCTNGNCIKRAWYCDNGNDCGDNSDEQYCNIKEPCPVSPPFVKCHSGSYRCVPEYFLCDGTGDCPAGEDERDCTNLVLVAVSAKMRKVLAWIKNQRKTNSSTETWGTQVDKSAVALYFVERNFTFTNDATRRDLAYEISIQLLSVLSTKKLQEIPSTDLASFVNAFLVTCLDPREFHGMDIIQELRTRVNKQNYTNPYLLLSLCNAGDTITELDKAKLIDTFRNKHRPFWTDMQAYVVMALACANKQSKNDEDLEQIREFTMELKQHQYRNGSVENLQTTALVMQALISAESDRDPDNFDEKKALEEIMSKQEPDGSFGDLLNTYFVIPVLHCKSLVDINSDHCEFVQRDEISALEKLANQGGAKIHVQYSLWIGNEKDLKRNLVLRVPANVSFYRIMEIAAEIDTRYRFEYIVKDSKPYINGISRFRDNPEKGKYWFLYTVKDGEPSPSQNSPADVTPKENDHFVMWYRSGSWID